MSVKIRLRKLEAKFEKPVSELSDDELRHIMLERGLIDERGDIVKTLFVEVDGSQKAIHELSDAELEHIMLERGI